MTAPCPHVHTIRGRGRLRKDDRGTHSRNMRWHETSKRIFSVLLKQGGPKTWRFLHETLEAPAESTVRAELVAGDDLGDVFRRHGVL